MLIDMEHLPAIPEGSPRRRRPVNENPFPTQESVAPGAEVVPYEEDSPVKPVDYTAAQNAIAAGRSFTHPSTEFPAWEEIKQAVFEKFVEQSGRPNMTSDKVKDPQFYFNMVNDLITKNPQWRVQPIQLERLIEILRVYQFGYGPLEDYMHMEGLEDLYFNRYDEGFYIVNGRKHLIKDQVFADKQDLVTFVRRVANENGLDINESKPNLDATLKDGSRLNATLPPLAVDGPDFVIRQHRPIPFTIEQYIATGMMTQQLADDLGRWVRSSLNIVVSGGTGSGKTSLLNCLGNTFIPKSDRVLILENRKELQIKTQDTKYYVTREDASRENLNSTDITMKDLIRYCLRKNPDRIIVGEVRGAEAYYALSAWNSGHDGSFCTVHADNTASALDKLEQLSMEAGKLSEVAVRKQISRSIDIQVERDKNRVRRITEVSQVFHPRKYDRRQADVTERVRQLITNKTTGLYNIADDLYLLPLYELDSNDHLVKVNDLIPIQGKQLVDH
jgi:Flp pilus assembly CpaF family ATPase